MNDPQLRLIQVDESLSRTASRAWQWVPVRASAESALAAGVARVLLEERLVAWRGPMPSLTLAEAAERTGLSADAIRDLARTIVARTPAVAIGNGIDPEIAALNVVLGAAATPGGIVRRSKRGAAYVPADAAMPSVRAALIDASVPWDFAPQTDAEVFRFAAWDGGSSRADWLLPAPGFLEELMDVPTAPTLAAETYAIAPSLTKPPAEVQSAAQFLGGIDPSLTPVDKIIHSRCGNLFHARAGTLIGREATPVAKIASAQALEEQLQKGAVWVGEAARPGGWRCELKEWPAAASGPPENLTATWSAPVLPPLATKLYQESSLREMPASRNA